MEAIKCIITAWAWAFILLFLISTTENHPAPIIVLPLLGCAITGAGWIYYRCTKK